MNQHIIYKTESRAPLFQEVSENHHPMPMKCSLFGAVVKTINMVKVMKFACNGHANKFA